LLVKNIVVVGPSASDQFGREILHRFLRALRLGVS
jgi:hypothetical protein